jgi:hypothetical protein
VDETLRLISFFENPYGVGWTMHPSLLIDVISKGHHHRYKLHPIFYFFMGFHMVPLLKKGCGVFLGQDQMGPALPLVFGSKIVQFLLQVPILLYRGQS